jgi:hypothetical protein
MRQQLQMATMCFKSVVICTRHLCAAFAYSDVQVAAIKGGCSDAKDMGLANLVVYKTVT